jgi:hypothetical protein
MMHWLKTDQESLRSSLSVIDGYMQRTDDRAEIIELLSRHQIYIDLKDADSYASLYAEDGSYESPSVLLKELKRSQRCSLAYRHQGLLLASIT